MNRLRVYGKRGRVPLLMSENRAGYLGHDRGERLVGHDDFVSLPVPVADGNAQLSGALPQIRVAHAHQFAALPGVRKFPAGRPGAAPAA